MHIVVTGAAGFIGSNVVRALNRRGEKSIIAVDNLAKSEKFHNLVDCEVADYFDKNEFIARVAEGRFDDEIAAVLHQGACSDTMETDGRYMMENNYRYSVDLLEFCQNQDIPFIYASSASVYGADPGFREERPCEGPLNIYGYSKFLFDQYVRRIGRERTGPVVGLRYFNVYGPGEAHKGRMASVAWHFFNQYRSTGKVKLFQGSDGYAPGEQRRDFVHVDDVALVNMFFLDNPERSGIFNVGTGAASSFNEVARAVVNACRGEAAQAELSLQAMQEAGLIEYVDFPAALVGKYQSFTQADLSRLRAQGYSRPFADVPAGVGSYVRGLLAGGPVNL